MPEAQLDGDKAFCILEPWIPVQFGSVILCIGPSDQAWPEDAQLLRRCFTPEAAEPDEPSRPFGARLRSARSLLMSAAAASFAMIAAATQGSGSDADLSVAAADAPHRPVQHDAGPIDADPTDTEAAAAEEPRTEASEGNVRVDQVASQGDRDFPGAAPRADLVKSLTRDLGAALDGLSVEDDGERIIIRGVLPTREAVDRLHARLDAVRGPALSRRFVAAQEIVDRMSEALPTRNLVVRHAGQSRFEVVGTVDDVPRAKAAVERVSADLRSFGVQVSVNLQPRGGSLPAMSGLFVDSQGASFLRTRDGVKHIVVPGNAKLATDVPGAPVL